MQPLIANLFSGPLDIVGDIHGEIDALHRLLSVMGYNAHGEHPLGRRLIFVGDLVDRGPDSPAVVELVQNLVKRELAQCIIGNHELNILRNDAKAGNGWIIETNRTEQQRGGEFAHSRIAPNGFREQFLEFISELPLALRRDDLRVVHAAWIPSSIAAVEAERGSVMNLYSHFAAHSKQQMEVEGLPARAAAERKRWKDALKDRHARMELLTALGEFDERHQMGNPVRVLTSGVERLASKPFWSSGQWRMCDRVRWWDEYEEAPAVVVGHYWRRLKPIAGSDHASSKPDLFAGARPTDWLGPRRNVFCVDFSVGARYEERKKGASRFDTMLCAMRWPERELWGEGGQVIA